MNKQLYKLIRDVEYPNLDGFDTETGEVIIENQVLQGQYSMVWPNGEPCLVAEMYLLDKSWTVKVSKKGGGTLGNYAKNISHLLKFCFDKKIQLWDLTHKCIDDFVDKLCNETDIYNKRIRNNNTVKNIISNCIDFLVWIQENLVRDRRIVGVDDKIVRYQIKLVSKVSSYKGKKGYGKALNVFPLSVPSAVTPRKRPIATVNIKKLWTTLSEEKSTLSNKLKGKFTKKQQTEHIEYMYRRRELQLILLEATGLRPQELITIECASNKNNLIESKLSIPTLKGRIDSRENKRLIPIDRSIAIKIELFISLHREKLIQRLLTSNIIESVNDIDDVLYLNAENGKEVLPDAAYQEFRRLTAKAGIKEKSCQSMFRHRFITNMVKLHLISFMDKNPLKNQHIMTDNDYRTILKKIASFTGHKDHDSLFEYIDLAWEELDAFAHTHEVQTLQGRLKSIFYIVHSIKSDINGFSKRSINQKTKLLINGYLSEIEGISSLLK